MSGAAPGWGSWGFEPLAVAAVAAGAVWYRGLYGRARRGAQRGEGATAGAGAEAEAGASAETGAGTEAGGGTAAGAGTAAGRGLGGRAVRGGRVGAALWLPFAGGLALLALATLSPLGALAGGWLLTASTVQHVLLSDVAPALIVLGLRAPMLFGQRWPARLRGRAVAWVAIPAWIAFTWLWAIPGVADYVAGRFWLEMVEHLSLFASGLALWWLIVDPAPSAGARAAPNGQRMGILGATHVASACVCVPLMWLSHTQYPLFASAPRAYGISAITDQHIAGGAMTLIELTVFAIAFAAVFISVLIRADADDGDDLVQEAVAAG